MSKLDPARDILRAIWDAIETREQHVGFHGLLHEERVFLVIGWLTVEVDNGGFAQYMFNPSGDHAELAVAALREVGATDMAAVCERFFALLPGGSATGDQDARQAQLDAAAETAGEIEFDTVCSELEQQFYALEDDLYERLHAYARKHGMVPARRLPN